MIALTIGLLTATLGVGLYAIGLRLGAIADAIKEAGRR
jgi:hypothetical protein